MRRRELLGTVGALITTGLAGCPALSGDEGDAASEQETLTPAPVPTTAEQSRFETPTPRRTVGRPVANVDGSGDGAVPDRAAPAAFDTTTCPAADSRGRVLCYPEQNPDRATLSLGPTAASVASDSGVGFVLVNHDGAPFTFNPNDWRLHGFDPERETWTVIERGPGTLPLVTVGAGEYYIWLAGLDGTTPNVSHGEQLALDLDAGRYAFGVTGLYGARRADTDEGRPVTCLTPFAVSEVELTISRERADTGD